MPPPDLRYGDVEATLVRAFRVEDDGLIAFRNRLRHLRKFNLAGLPKTGTGRQISYTMDHIRLMYLGLKLNYFGILPEPLSRLFREHRNDILDWFHRAEAADPNRTCVRVALLLQTHGVPSGDERWVMHGLIGEDGPGAGSGRRGFEATRRVFHLDVVADPYLVLNISVFELVLREALERARAERGAGLDDGSLAAAG